MTTDQVRSWEGFLYDLNPYLLSSIAGLLLAAQIVLGLVLDNQAAIPAVRYAGWGVWALGAVFGVLPIFALRRGGGVPQGESYMQTKVLVEDGIYAIVRHPQSGVAGVLLCLAVALIAQHWLVAALGLVAMGLFYLDTFKLDRSCIEKFGDAYGDYMQRVPRVNFLAGIVRLLQK
jgi:protein-S-isoprenylcysteine O-methyltransferase Ste14